MALYVQPLIHLAQSLLPTCCQSSYSSIFFLVGGIFFLGTTLSQGSGLLRLELSLVTQMVWLSTGIHASDPLKFPTSSQIFPRVLHSSRTLYNTGPLKARVKNVLTEQTSCKECSAIFFSSCRHLSCEHFSIHQNQSDRSYTVSYCTLSTHTVAIQSPCTLTFVKYP